MGEHSQFRLFTQRRFLPFFGAQALGAFNDNVYKNVLVILAVYHASDYTRMEPSLLSNVAAGLFILPFVLFSGMAGQLADRFDKTLVLKAVKAFEILIMVAAGIGFGTHSIEILLAALFMMGVHSTFFAPAKYGLLPEVLADKELVGGNALIETGTFLAILLGTLAAGILAQGHIQMVIATLIAIAVLGFVFSLGYRSCNPRFQDCASIGDRGPPLGTTSAQRANRARCSCPFSAFPGFGFTARSCLRNCRCMRRTS